MRARHLAGASVAGVVVFGLLVSIMPADPPLLGESPSKQEINAHMQQWIDQIATGETAEAVFSAAEGAIDDLGRFSDSGVQADMVIAAVDGVIDLLADLSDSDELRSVREINAARIVAGLKQLAARRALGELIAHANPAVRYYGWVGYGNIRNMCLRSENLRGGLVAGLSSRAGQEDSGVVVGEICRVLSLPERMPDELDDPTVYKAVAAEFVAILHDNWGAWLPQAAADFTWADALTEGVTAVANLATIMEIGDDDELKTELLQDLVNAAGAGAALYRTAQDGYIRADELAEQAAGERQQKAEQLTKESQLLAADAARAETAAAGMLLACEDALNELAGTDNDHLRLPLSGWRRVTVSGRIIERKIGSRSQRADAVQLGVITWDKELGLNQPQVTTPAE